jgi:hypothetical protein
MMGENPHKTQAQPLPIIFMKQRILLTFIVFFLYSWTVFSQNEIIDSSIISVDTATIENEFYKAIYRKDNYFIILNSMDSVVFKKEKSYMLFEFIDFDNDGNKDLIFSYFGSIERNDLLLFETESKSFRMVENFIEFPAAKQIEKTKFYYSYHKSGCADGNWDSDLFIIENFRAIKIGNIAGRQCENIGEKDGIYIYKIKMESEILFESLDIGIIDNYENYKWGFIKDYWSKNYLKFE